jgi:uncharacterized integral membrane protein
VRILLTPSLVLCHADNVSDHEEFDEQPGPRGRNGPGVFLVLTILIAAITAVFVTQNRERTQIEFLFFDFTSRIWTAIAIAIGLGILLDRLFLAWWRRARKNKNRT